MIRTAVRPLGLLAVVASLLLGGVACSGSEDASPSDTTGATDTTVDARTASTNPAMGDLSDLDGATNGLSGDELACHDLSLAFVALSLTPFGSASGASEADVDQLRADVETLRSQVPDAVSSAFDTYATGVQAYAEALADVDLSDLTAPATQQELIAAAAALESPEMVQAADEVEAFFASTCPAPASPTTAP